ncbi:hypothetical protein AN221_23875 [Streptomyces nanshensis]|uniref:Uncharacterized protein n=1 Tax=Streptomyces nanshensis TaxID=518642 RepID=A0A1E7LPT0_9ACTN|nr:hypothetical protein AN221_23875 [Streptomyces nanshensis]
MSSERQTAPVSMVDLPLPDRLEPVGVPGCRGCAQIVDERASARAKGDLSKVSDCNVELARHPHRRRAAR